MIAQEIFHMPLTWSFKTDVLWDCIGLWPGNFSTLSYSKFCPAGKGEDRISVIVAKSNSQPASRFEFQTHQKLLVGISDTKTGTEKVGSVLYLRPPMRPPQLFPICSKVSMVQAFKGIPNTFNQMFSDGSPI